MLRMDDPEKRAEAEFFIKQIALVVSAVWILLAGTALIVKTRAKLDLNNAKLSSASIPSAQHTLKIKTNNKPYKGTCWVTGIYTITNTGELPFIFSDVTIEVYELPIIKFNALNNTDIVSGTLMKRLENMEPIWTDKIEEIEVVGIDNSLERLFSYYIRKKPDYYYAFVASANGGLPVYEDGTVSIREDFGTLTNDFKHFEGPVDICPSP